MKPSRAGSLLSWWTNWRDARRIRLAYERLTAEQVRHIVSLVGGHIADVLKGGPGRATDLPFPAMLIELAYLKALRDWPVADRTTTVLEATYVNLDEYMLSAADYEALTEWNKVVKDTAEALRVLDEPNRAHVSMQGAEALSTVPANQAPDVRKRLADKSRRRLATIERIRSNPASLQ